ncbi:hypothetical protein RCL1_000572 [Eukaryota sp. TZLM3-RCL]
MILSLSLAFLIMVGSKRPTSRLSLPSVQPPPPSSSSPTSTALEKLVSLRSKLRSEHHLLSSRSFHNVSIDVNPLSHVLSTLDAALVELPHVLDDVLSLLNSSSTSSLIDSFLFENDKISEAIGEFVVQLFNSEGLSSASDNFSIDSSVENDLKRIQLLGINSISAQIDAELSCTLLEYLEAHKARDQSKIELNQSIKSRLGVDNLMELARDVVSLRCAPLQTSSISNQAAINQSTLIAYDWLLDLLSQQQSILIEAVDCVSKDIELIQGIIGIIADVAVDLNHVISKISDFQSFLIEFAQKDTSSINFDCFLPLFDPSARDKRELLFLNFTTNFLKFVQDFSSSINETKNSLFKANQINIEPQSINDCFNQLLDNQKVVESQLKEIIMVREHARTVMKSDQNRNLWKKFLTCSNQEFIENFTVS